MEIPENCQGKIWLLTGTGDGPPLAKVLLSKGWRVTVSVVSYEAAFAYEGIDLEQILVGPLNGVEGICSVLKDADHVQDGFDYVIDATHPFATEITSNLQIACLRIGNRLIRYERFLGDTSRANFIKEFDDLLNFDLKEYNLLLAIGSKYLNLAVEKAQQAGAIPFARVLPKVNSLQKSLSSGISANHLAVLQPLKDYPCGELEAAICRKWHIQGVLCRQSGGRTQEIWHSICSNYNIDLFLISRPEPPFGIEVVTSIEKLLKCID